MSIDPVSDSTGFPLWVRVLLLPVVWLALLAFFVFLGFPYDDLADTLSVEVEKVSGVALQFDDVSPHLGLLGPGLAAEGVTASGAEGLRVELDEAIIRPAWSLSWFSLEPAIHLDLKREEARVSGTVFMSSEPGWEGEVKGIDLDLLPVEGLIPGGSIDGTLSADADLRMLEDGLTGSLLFTVANGSLGLPGSPFGVPFDVLEGDILFGGDLFAQVNKLDLDGAMIAAKAQGSVGKAARRGDEALDLNVDIKVMDNNLKGVVRGLGVRVAGDGVAKLRVTGPLSAPEVLKGG